MSESSVSQEGDSDSNQMDDKYDSTVQNEDEEVEKEDGEEDDEEEEEGEEEEEEEEVEEEEEEEEEDEEEEEPPSKKKKQSHPTKDQKDTETHNNNQDDELLEDTDPYFITKWKTVSPSSKQVILQYSDIENVDLWLIKVPVGFDKSSLTSLTLQDPDDPSNPIVGAHLVPPTPPGGEGETGSGGGVGKKYIIREATRTEALSKVSIFPHHERFCWGNPFVKQLDFIEDVSVEVPLPHEVKEKEKPDLKKKKKGGGVPKICYVFAPAGAVAPTPPPPPIAAVTPAESTAGPTPLTPQEKPLQSSKSPKAPPTKQKPPNKGKLSAKKKKSKTLHFI